jgi:hypothetical protein
MHFSLYSLFGTDREKALAVAERMSHLIDLVAKCPAGPGANAMEALVLTQRSFRASRSFHRTLRIWWSKVRGRGPRHQHKAVLKS